MEPRSSYDSAVNVVIRDKRNGQIRINIGNIHRNFGNEKNIILCTDTTKNTTQWLNEATIVSEIDMGWEFNQVTLDKQFKDKSVFLTLEGLHRMERLYFSYCHSSGIFHSKVRKAVTGLRGATKIYDNIFVCGNNYRDHFNKLAGAFTLLGSLPILSKLLMSNKHDHQTALKRSGIC